MADHPAEKKRDFSLLFFEACMKTYGNRNGRRGSIEVRRDHFSFPPLITAPPGPHYLVKASDGIGTKVEVAERMNRHDTLAFDLLAMVCDDLVRRGAEPLAVSEILDVGALEEEAAHSLARGLIEAAAVARVAVVAGEVAEMPERIQGHGASRYNWAADALGIARPDELITGDTIQEGDALVALQEEGCRSNGFTKIRQILSSRYGADWHMAQFEAGQCWGDILLVPSRIYTPLILDFRDAHPGGPAALKGIAHITGGGIPEKLGRLLISPGLGAFLNGCFSPCRALSLLQELGSVDDEVAYGTWNMGNGMILAVEDPGPFIEFAGAMGYQASTAGHVTGDGRIRIYSKGRWSHGSLLTF